MFGLFKKKNIVNELKAPVDGTVVSVTEAKDDVFSSCMLGKGVVIHPTSGILVAPADGEVSVVMEGTNHAIGLKLSNGVDLLLHIGLDTVGLQGKGFQAFAKMGDKVTTGQKLIEFDRQIIKDNGLCDDVIFIVLDGENVPATMEYKTGMNATAGETIVASW